MTGIITITTISINIPYLNLYSDVDGFISAFETNIPRSLLISGYSTNLIPTGTTIVRAASSVGPCTNYIDIELINCQFDGSIECILNTTTTTTTAYIPVTGLSWVTTVNNPCNPEPWTISDDNTTIRYDVEDSLNCGGTCGFIQAGTATATITVDNVDTYLYLDFEGIGELEKSDFELIKFKLDGVQIANAHAPGGNLGCEMGSVVKEYDVAPPYFLPANSVHTFEIDFTTNDNLFHVGSYYEVSLSFSNSGTTTTTTTTVAPTTTTTTTVAPTTTTTTTVVPSGVNTVYVKYEAIN
jgi:hypothetical protein